ncbi:lytic transglycosylase domain-containing protein [Paracidobacterium acidisoli]|uniref:LysM peptidoglycan-binding domain-containing protein n=1 Tax=Paracidobacterium acidisoli TaxID=2303751 RepID=A0A372IQS6_9BACT|nr:lytic transglycosylase domain-containing protein [Paracidobacterium acidisoli]MBT9331461.1 transglycosylase SLT domain-containing protein [Paracidobacterium acidisoli]
MSRQKAEQDQQLIDTVEKAWQTGMQNYQQGHAAAAKANFDYAVDLMLTSGLDIRNDPALSAEFDRIVDAENTQELDALRQKTNAASQAAEPAPVDIANDVTFPVDPNVKAQAEAELKVTQSDLPLVMNDPVASFINFFTHTTLGHNTIVGSLTRAGRYKEMIQRVLKEEGVPQDLFYLAVAESGFRPQAVNPRSDAAGMWQFMPYGTYGLRRTAWYDERFDPEKSTRAYAREIKANYEQLGDWYLAMAAYDWGAGNVQRAVQRTGYADFWELYRRNNLPAETKNYVPIIIAVTIMAKNPKQYGLDDLAPDPPLLDDTVTTDYAVDLRLVSDITGAPLQEIEALNPSLLRMSTPPDEPFDLHLPAGAKAGFEQTIAEIPEDKRRYWRYHVLQPSDTISDIARTYHVSTSEIAFVNQLSSTEDLSGVDALVIPVAPSSAPSSLRTARYKVRHGDTVVTVADRFGVTVEQLRRWNHLKGSELAVGRSLYVSEPARITGSSRGRHGRGTRRHASAKETASHSTAASERGQKRSGGHPARRVDESRAHAVAGSSAKKKKHI